MGASMSDPGLDSVRTWFDAFNAHDVDAMLQVMAPDVRVEPVRVLSGPYHGHAGVRRMFADVEQRLGRQTDALTIDDVKAIGDGRVLMRGRAPDGTSFTAVHELDDEGRILTARHYLSDEATLWQIGVLGTDVV